MNEWMNECKKRKRLPRMNVRCVMIASEDNRRMRASSVMSTEKVIGTNDCRNDWQTKRRSTNHSTPFTIGRVDWIEYINQQQQVAIGDWRPLLDRVIEIVRKCAMRSGRVYVMWCWCTFAGFFGIASPHTVPVPEPDKNVGKHSFGKVNVPYKLDATWPAWLYVHVYVCEANA